MLRAAVHAQAPVEKIPWGLLLSKPAVWALIICHFCHNWGTFILLTWMPSYYNQVCAAFCPCWTPLGAAPCTPAPPIGTSRCAGAARPPRKRVPLPGSPMSGLEAAAAQRAPVQGRILGVAGTRLRLAICNCVSLAAPLPTQVPGPISGKKA